MNKHEQQHQIEEAVDLIAARLETFESCQVRYGRRAWSTMESQVRTQLLLQEAGQLNERLAQHNFDPDALWLKLQPQLKDQLIEKMLARLISETPSADSGSEPPQSEIYDKFRLLTFSRQHQKSSAAPKRNSAIVQTFYQSPLGRMVAGLAILLICSTLFAGVAQASEPGDLLYGPKVNVVERLPEVFAFSDQDKTQARLSYAQRRLDEIERAISKGNYSKLEETLQLYKATVTVLTDQPSREVITQLAPQKERLLALEKNKSVPVQLLDKLEVITKTIETAQPSAPSTNQSGSGVARGAKTETPTALAQPGSIIPITTPGPSGVAPINTGAASRATGSTVGSTVEGTPQPTSQDGASPTPFAAPTETALPSPTARVTPPRPVQTPPNRVPPTARPNPGDSGSTTPSATRSPKPSAGSTEPSPTNAVPGIPTGVGNKPITPPGNGNGNGGNSTSPPARTTAPGNSGNTSSPGSGSTPTSRGNGSSNPTPPAKTTSPGNGNGGGNGGGNGSGGPPPVPKR